MQPEARRARNAILHLLQVLSKVNPRAAEEKYRERELYRSAHVEPPLALRLDGVGWGRRLSGVARAPRDEHVHIALLHAAGKLVEFFNACCAYVASDEINLVIMSKPPYGARVEKLVSISAGLASAVVSSMLGLELFFDSRVVKLYSPSDAYDYILYRARVAFNNYISTVYHEAYGAKRVTPHLREMLEALLSRHDFNPAAWELAGTCLARVEAERRLGEIVAVRRRLVAIDSSLELCRRACMVVESRY